MRWASNLQKLIARLGPTYEAIHSIYPFTDLKRILTSVIKSEADYLRF